MPRGHSLSIYSRFSTEGNLRLKIDWASLKVGSKFTVFALFYFVFEGNFPIKSPGGITMCIWRGDLTEGFFTLPVYGGSYVEGLIFEILRYLKDVQNYLSLFA